MATIARGMIITPKTRSIAQLVPSNTSSATNRRFFSIRSCCVPLHHLTETSSSSRRFFSNSSGGEMSSSSSSNKKKPKALFLNAARLDYDKKLDFSRIESLCELTRIDTDYVRDIDEMVSLVSKDGGYDILITKEMEVPLSAFERFPKTLRLLCEAGTGYNNLPILAARTQRNIPVCNIPTYSTDAVAHMAITYLMNLSVRMFDQQKMLWENNRANFTGPFTLPLEEINDKTLGLVGGSGLIGSRVADIALALGMNIVISSRSGSLPVGHRHKNNPRVVVVRSENMARDLLPRCDYVSLHTPLNDATRGSFGKEQIASMKPTAFLINTSRGAVCNEDELIDCLKRGVIAGAGLDVTTTEPPPEDSELWTLPNVWLSPHTGWRRIETRQRLVNMTADNIEAFCNASTEDDLINVVNK